MRQSCFTSWFVLQRRGLKWKTTCSQVFGSHLRIKSKNFVSNFPGGMWEKVKSDIKYEDKPMKGERLKWAQNSIFLYSAWCAPPKKKILKRLTLKSQKMWLIWSRIDSTMIHNPEIRGSRITKQNTHYLAHQNSGLWVNGKYCFKWKHSSGKDEGHKLLSWGMVLLLCIIVKRS